MEVTFTAFAAMGDGTEVLLHQEVPLRGAEFSRELNGVGRLSGSVPPEFLHERNADGIPVVEEWTTIVYPQVNGRMFDGYILSDVNDGESEAVLDFVSFIGYWDGMPYESVLAESNYPVANVIRELAGNVGAKPHGNLGMTVSVEGVLPNVGIPDFSKLPPRPKAPVKPRPFTAKQPQAPKYPTLTGDNSGRKRLVSNYATEKRDYEKALASWRKNRDAAAKAEKAYKDGLKAVEDWEKERDREIESSRYEINFWSTHDILREFQSLSDECEFSYRVDHWWEGERPKHVLRVWPGAGRRRHGIDFIEGENVYSVPRISRGGEKKADHIRVLGSGEGASTRTHGYGVLGSKKRGLGRIVTITDKTASTTARMNAIARKRWGYVSQPVDIETFTVVDHDLAPLDQFDVGDEILFQPLLRRGDKPTVYVTVIAVDIDAEKGVAEVTVVPSGGVFG